MFLRYMITKRLTLGNTINDGKTSIERAINNGKTWIYKIVLMTLTTMILIFVSILIYTSFYFSYIPTVLHEVGLFIYSN